LAWLKIKVVLSCLWLKINDKKPYPWLKITIQEKALRQKKPAKERGPYMNIPLSLFPA
jgi:hypothetical protein